MATAWARRCKKHEGKVQASQDVSREDEEKKTIEGDKGSAGHVSRQDTRRQSVDGELTTWMTMIMK